MIPRDPSQLLSADQVSELERWLEWLDGAPGALVLGRATFEAHRGGEVTVSVRRRRTTAPPRHEGPTKAINPITYRPVCFHGHPADECPEHRGRPSRPSSVQFPECVHGHPVDTCPERPDEYRVCETADRSDG